MKADLPRLEPQIQSIWDNTDIYRRIQDAWKGAPTFILHYGQPTQTHRSTLERP